MSASRSPSRILAIKLADLGDLLICEPAFRSLRAAFPDARIDVLTTPTSAGLLDLIGHRLTPIPFPKHLFDSPTGLAHPRTIGEAARLANRLRTSRYDRVVIFHHLTTAFGSRKFQALVRATGCKDIAGLDNGRGAFLTRPVLDHGFGAMSEAEYMVAVAVCAGGLDFGAVPKIEVPMRVENPVRLPMHFAALFPSTGRFSTAREWFPERYASIASTLAARGVRPVIVGADDARQAAQLIQEMEPATIDMTGQTSLLQLSQVLQRSRIAIGGDTFIGHLAAAVGTPVVSIFGPSNAEAWCPAGAIHADSPIDKRNKSVIVRHALPCQPCIYTGFRLGRPAGCADRTCLKMISVSDVNRAIAGVLEES